MKRILIATFLSIVACSSDHVSSPQESKGPTVQEDKIHTGMAAIRSEKKSITLGSKLKVNFSYNFSIDSHEVTCGEYARLVTTTNCDNIYYPITNVSFFDAVLFANKKSKEENLDTAYSYTDISYDHEGHCVNLSGFAFHADKDAYRLPTEAEWTFAASQNWNPQNGWNTDNSDYHLHERCTAKDIEGTDSLLCDFAGNAMEWVNDWKGNFSDTAVTNFVGAPNGGSIDERVVKGGSYRNTVSETTLDNRGDIYTVTSSTRANYVGFRLAFGKIPNAVWMNEKGKSTTTPISILATYKQLKNFTSTYLNKFAFRNEESANITVVSLSSGIPTLKEIENTAEAYHPVISPDGKYIAYSTKFEGISGTSELYVQRIDTVDAPKIKLDVESAAIPRWRVTEKDTEIVYVTTAESNSDESKWKSASTWSIPFTAGKFGTPKKLFDGTFNGGVSADNNLAISGARLLRAKVNGNNQVWYNKEQACNASLSDSTKQTLFLDFAGNTGKEFAGHKYTTHEELLIADSTGKLIKTIPAPKGFTFDHTEWVQSSSNLAIATLTQTDGTHPKIVLINTDNSSITEIAEGANFWHPNFWAGVHRNIKTKLDLDSAGMYELNNPFTGDLSTMRTRYDLEMLYKHRDSINVLISGSSRPWAGINPTVLNKSKSGIFSINTANAAVDISVAKRIILNYGFNFLPKLKIGVISIDPDILFGRYYDTRNYWKIIFSHSPGFVYDEAHDFWSDGYPEGLYELTRDSYGNNDENRADEQADYGFKEVPPGGWQGSPVHHDTTMMDAETNLDEMLLEDVEDFLAEAEKKSVYIIGIIFPQSPDYRETGAFGRYGLRRSVALKMIENLHQFEEKYPHFRLMDENKMGNHDYSSTEAGNFDHLSYKGADKLTKRLDSLIQTLP